ncbi:ABC transporter permease [Rossellomorea arthrocnemi]|uniref:ABC transporter permease n=1 Tax=Rossellomorea arthrocnemi TaxID=2769542 RepID=UPI001E4901B7|nr:ABC transporter permease [Rossellomorea arthrocnemi]
MLLVGALIVSTGLSYLVGVTQSNSGTIVDELQNRWKSSYHIVVRPPDTRSVTEDLNLLEPNYQSGLSGGISLEQYNQIKEMSDIDIAAPIAMIGFVNNDMVVNKVAVREPGVYRLNIKDESNTGAGIDTENGSLYFTVGGWEPDGVGREYGTIRYNGELPLSYGSEVMLAGIDPDAESKLVGLSDAMVEDSHSEYFDNNDKSEKVKIDTDITETAIPVIISNKEFVESKRTFTISKLDLPFSSDEQASTMEKVKENGGEAYLEKQEGTKVDSFTYTTKEVHKNLINEILSPSENQMDIDLQKIIGFKASPVEYKPVTSPFSERWPFAYEVKPYSIPEDVSIAETEAYRPVTMFGDEFKDFPRVKLNIKGVFNPGKLNLSKDPLTELPMETYFPSKSNWVLDKNENPVNPPKEMKPLNNPYGFLTKPPLMLTTLDAAADVMGEKPISSIRIKVKGVDQLNDASEKRLNEVASAIESQTGLITDVTLGSSPQPALTHIPGLKGKESLGWVEQPWIKLGSSMSIFKEAKVGLSGVIASVILVAIVYVFSSNLIMMFTRQKEFAVLLSIGWRPNQLSKLLFLEATLLGVFVSLISWTILGYFYFTSEITTSLTRFFLIGLFGLLIYLIGTIIPAYLVRKIKPYETMKSGEIAHSGKRWIPSRTIWSMSFNSFISKWKRSILSVISIALPTSLFVVYLFITFRLKGVMYATWLGEYVAMEVSSLHYIAMGVALLIAILTTTEIIWQNVSERQPEIALLKSIGWHNRIIRHLVLLEGAFSGLFAGIIGVLLAFVFVWKTYDQLPTDQLPFFLVSIVIPVVTGMIGALFPAHRAVKTLPYQALGGSAEHSKKTEKRLKVALGTLGIGLFIGLLSILGHAVPEVKKATSDIEEPQNIEGTDGETTEVFKTATRNEKDSKKNPIQNSLQKKMESAWKVIEIDEELNELVTLSYTLGESKEESNASTEEIKVNSKMIYPEGSANDGSILAKLNGYTLLDEEGYEYQPVETIVTQKKEWNGVYLKPGGEINFSLIFDIPKNKEKLILQGVHSFLPGNLLVEIKK